MSDKQFEDLLRLLTGHWVPSSTWYRIGESNAYTFDFEGPSRKSKIHADKIRAGMDSRDCALLKCTACKSRRVDPIHYRVDVNAGRARRYVHLEVKGLDCAHLSVYDFDD